MQNLSIGMHVKKTYSWYLWLIMAINSPTLSWLSLGSRATTRSFPKLEWMAISWSLPGLQLKPVT
jgi:hypothetical protein